MKTAVISAFLTLHLCLGIGSARAAEADPPQCATVKMASPGWVDIDSTNALLSEVLRGLGYEPKVRNLSVPLTYEGLRSGQLDIFLGNWMPAQKLLVSPLLEQGKIDRIGANLEGARFTLAVPDYAANAGIRSFSDLAAHAKELSLRIYGIEAGAPANETIKRIINSNAFGLHGWQLVESSDSGLLAQLTHDLNNHRMIVFLAWEPHVINSRFKIHYLEGGDEYFGANAGAATVGTVSRHAYAQQCPNLARLLGQVKFTVALENEMIRRNMDLHESFTAASRSLLKAQPSLLKSWLTGVSTRDGKDGLAAVTTFLSR